jgi:predicted nucleic-acid-binding protein
MRLDANVVLRFLLADDREQSASAESLLADAPPGSLTVSSLSLAEVAWVLLSHYEAPRAAVATALQRVLAVPAIRAEATVVDAVARFAATSLDFADCALAAEAVASGEPAVSFDRGLRAFRDLRALQPQAARQALTQG